MNNDPEALALSIQPAIHNQPMTEEQRRHIIQTWLGEKPGFRYDPVCQQPQLIFSLSGDRVYLYFCLRSDENDTVEDVERAIENTPHRDFEQLICLLHYRELLLGLIS